MAELDVSVATATFLIFFESIEVIRDTQKKFLASLRDVTLFIRLGKILIGPIRGSEH